MPSDYGAIGYHWRTPLLLLDLYVWHRGPWRLSWIVKLGAWPVGAIEVEINRHALGRIATDLLWGFRRRSVQP